jgi:hypothetical protein
MAPLPHTTDLCRTPSSNRTSAPAFEPGILLLLFAVNRIYLQGALGLAVISRWNLPATPLVESSIRQIIMIISIYSHIGNNKGQDTENQLDELRRYAGSQQREVYLFVDREAGKTGHRAEFQKPIPLCRAPRVPSRAGMGPGSLHRRECRRGLRKHPGAWAVLGR